MSLSSLLISTLPSPRKRGRYSLLHQLSLSHAPSSSIPTNLTREIGSRFGRRVGFGARREDFALLPLRDSNASASTRSASCSGVIASAAMSNGFRLDLGIRGLLR